MPNTYTDTPISSHTLAADQPTMEANFLYLADTLGTTLKSGDHQISIGGVDNTSFEGRHLQSSYSNRHGAAPTVAGIADGTNAMIYSDNGNLFMDSATLAGPYQLTTVNATLPVAKFGAINNGWTFLGGGLIMQYGSVNSPGGSGTVTFPVTFPSSVYSVQLTLSRNASSTVVSAYVNSASAVGPSSFAYTATSSGSTTLYWVAIGK